mmetsp:Transcript_5092/g.14436  ORF Transcript_5092/g.14436 Transcript_5092/m.14436 type:complete len:218 (-) Transcript_5092:473-1126(-)
MAAGVVAMFAALVLPVSLSTLSTTTSTPPQLLLALAIALESSMTIIGRTFFPPSCPTSKKCAAALARTGWSAWSVPIRSRWMLALSVSRSAFDRAKGSAPSARGRTPAGRECRGRVGLRSRYHSSSGSKCMSGCGSRFVVVGGFASVVAAAEDPVTCCRSCAIGSLIVALCEPCEPLIVSFAFVRPAAYLLEVLVLSSCAASPSCGGTGTLVFRSCR